MAAKSDLARVGKFLSLVLRHEPAAAGVALDSEGWADVAALLDGMAKAGRRIDRAMLETIVRTDGKGRYAVSEDGTRIRANQGHSVAVDLNFAAADAASRWC